VKPTVGFTFNKVISPSPLAALSTHQVVDGGAATVFPHSVIENIFNLGPQ
jgi:hypothetical protein